MSVCNVTPQDTTKSELQVILKQRHCFFQRNLSQICHFKLLNFHLPVDGPQLQWFLSHFFHYYLSLEPYQFATSGQDLHWRCLTPSSLPAQHKEDCVVTNQPTFQYLMVETSFTLMTKNDRPKTSSISFPGAQRYFYLPMCFFGLEWQMHKKCLFLLGTL